MEIKTMQTEELEARLSAISTELDAPEADLDALEAEVREIKGELEIRKAAEAKRVELRSAVATGSGDPIKTIKTEEKKMTNEEIRSSKAYIDAFAEYIKTGDEKECRALLTENVSGTLPVPSTVEGRIRKAWQRNGLMELVRKTYFRGNLRVGFELSADAAVVHTEGTTAPTEETLTLGVVSLIPASFKKWITISDEAMDMGGQEFLDYIYDEVTYQIAKKAQAELLAKIIANTASATSTAVAVPSVTGTPSIGIVATAIGELSDSATDPVIVINKGTWAQFKAAQYAGSFNVDPFEGLRVFYDSSLPVYTTSATAGTWMIVGDFGRGAQANFPNGDEITLKFDDRSLAEADLVKVVGREYIGLGIVESDTFCKVTFE